MATTWTGNYTLSGRPLFSAVGESFLLGEDEALKNHLKGMTVSDDKNASRPVDVWFALPDMEIREQRFPFLLVELVDLQEARNREQRGLIPYETGFENEAFPTNWYSMVDYPIPYNLTYQVTAFARHPRHNRQIINQILRYKVPGRQLALAIEGDKSKRYMELLQWQSRDTVEGGRKLWQTVFTILVTSETSYLRADPLAQPVTEVDLDEEVLPKDQA